MSDQRTLKVSECARQLGLHANTVRRAIRDGRLPAFRFGGVLLIPAGAIDGLLASGGGKPDRLAAMWRNSGQACGGEV